MLIEENFVFCQGCGVELNREEVILTNYFEKGFQYEKILVLLAKFHDISMSLRTLKSRLKSYGLSRRSMNVDEEFVRRRIRQKLDGPGCLHGYRAMWHTLKHNGVFVQRHVVERLLREIDPEGCSYRRAKRLRRRNYVSVGPNYCWHMDGYDKLKPYGFPIHGCIDGFSRKIRWLKVTRSNNNPAVISQFYLEAVEEFAGCPTKVRTDCGTENGLVASMQCYFQDDENAHIYGTSPHNQQIEGWWSFFRRSRTHWWINFFRNLIEREVFVPGNELQQECLWFSFCGILQEDLDRVRNHWNSHYIRESRFDTIGGIPDELYCIPEYYGMNDFIVPVPSDKICHAINAYPIQNEENIFQEYFQYVVEANGLHLPTNWREALNLYHQLLNFAQG